MKIKPSELPELEPNPIFKDLPDHVKDVETYKKIEKSLADAIISDHIHKSIKEYTKCKRCNIKRERRSALIKEYGFISIQQYLEWKRVMQIIINGKDFQVQ